MVVTCALILVQAARRSAARPFATREQARPVLKVLWPAAAMVVLMQVTGLYVAAAVYIGFYMRWIGHHGWPAVVAVSVAVPVATFLIFETWFLVPMPKGPLEAWLGY
jgi:putative tricarboxylic transport membrane protein